MTLRLGHNFDRSIESLNPSRIDELSEAIILRNLYSPLFEYDEKGNIVTGLARTFVWENGSLKVSLITDPVFSDGSKVSIDDVIFSLKRLMFLGDNYHGDLKEILCPNHKLLSIDDDCPGLTVYKNEIIFKAHSEELSKQLIPLLATVDFRIIPKKSFNLLDKKYPIQDFKITSGPYSVSKYDSKGNFILEANQYHYRYSQQMPQIVEVYSYTYKQAVEKILNGEIDALSTSITITKDDYDKIKSKHGDLSVSKSFNLKINALFFGKKAIQDFTAEQRFVAAKVLKQDFYDKIVLPFEEPSIEFFQDFASGYLNKFQKDEINKLRQNSNSLSSSLRRKIKIAVYKRSIERWKDFLSKYSYFEPAIQESSPFYLSVSDRPDIFSGVNDVTFNKSISVLSYNLKQGIFGFYDDEANKWFRKYANAENSEEAIKVLNDLHFQALKNCAIYPLSVSPYILLARNGWIAKMNPFFSSTELWLIRKN